MNIFNYYALFVFVCLTIVLTTHFQIKIKSFLTPIFKFTVFTLKPIGLGILKQAVLHMDLPQCSTSHRGPWE